MGGVKGWRWVWVRQHIDVVEVGQLKEIVSWSCKHEVETATDILTWLSDCLWPAVRCLTICLIVQCSHSDNLISFFFSVGCVSCVVMWEKDLGNE
jgi:hypothetical protein